MLWLYHTLSSTLYYLYFSATHDLLDCTYDIVADHCGSEEADDVYDAIKDAIRPLDMLKDCYW